MNLKIFKLKDKPIAFQISVIIGLVLGLSAVIFSVVMPFVIRDKITKERYQRVAENQEFLLSNFEYPYIDQSFVPPKKIDSEHFGDKEHGPPIKFSRIIRHFYLDVDKDKVTGDFNQEVLNGIKEKALKQEKKIKSYTYELSDSQIIYYLVRKISNNESQKGYLVSYVHTYYRDTLFQEVFNGIMRSLIIVLFLSWLASIFVAKYLTKSLRDLNKEVKKIAKKEWDNPIEIKRKDEIGEVAQNIDWMRKQLLIRDKNQQNFLQEISHEIKTPIMVLRGYIQSMQDGIYPKKDLDGTLNAMEAESFKMENRLKSLINVTKINFISHQKLNKEKFPLNDCLKRRMERLSWRRSGVNWTITVPNLEYYGDQEKLTVALENIIDNQFKFASSIIKVEMEVKENNLKIEAEKRVLIKFWNDGPEIEPEKIEDIFNKFNKGKSGEYGLGLAISKIIIEAHGGEIWAINEEGGVSFYLELPFK
jgi:two-component system sensor histidine kinase CssS